MKVIILAAGRALGIGELCSSTPKCLLPFGNRTLLDRQIDIINECGVRMADILIVAGHHGEQIEAKYPTNVIYNSKYKTSDNATSLYIALKSVDDDVLIMDGDLAFDKTAVSALFEAGLDSLLAHNGDSIYGETGIIKDAFGNVKEIGKHITGTLIFDSIIYLSRNTAKAWKNLLDNALERKSWYTISLNKLVKDIPIRTIVNAGRVVDIDTYFDYIEAKRIFGIENFTILVAGASGLLGEKLYHILKRNYQVQGVQFHGKRPELSSLDLTDAKKVAAFIELQRPKVIINAAGIAEPELCNDNPQMAEAVNVRAVRNLVESCKKYNIKLIHISTDYVFDGNSIRPYCHTAERKPKNYYGELKKEAEDIVMEYDNSLIVRVPILYGYNSDNDKVTFPIRVIKTLRRGERLRLDNKQTRYPVLIDEVAIRIESALRQTGIIHITSEERCTKYTWAQKIAETFGLERKLIEEDENDIPKDRPYHTKLAIENGDYIVNGIDAGTDILAKQMNCVFRLIYKSHPDAFELGENVGAYRYKLGYALKASLPNGFEKKVDCVMPVPNSGLYYAMGLASAIQIPYIQGLVKPDNATRSFQIADIALRTQTIREKIVPMVELVKDRSIALVDEAIFTGITLKAVCDMLKGCGVGKIFICIPTPMCGCHCRQYVQPNRNLLAEIMSVDEIKDYFGVAGIYFQQYGVFKNSLACMENVCYECFMEAQR